MDDSGAIDSTMVGGNNLIRMSANRLNARHYLGAPSQGVGVGKDVSIKTFDTLTVDENIGQQCVGRLVARVGNSVDISATALSCDKDLLLNIANTMNSNVLSWFSFCVKGWQFSPFWED